MSDRKNILLIATGGTIASKKSDNGLKPQISPDELMQYIPQVKNICDFHAVQLLNLDSSNMEPKHWKMMVHTIRENYEKYDGFVIAHGTDTMAYTAAALSYMIQNSKKPIVITGAQKPIDLEITDAKSNLLDSFLYASDDKSQGVQIVFDGKVIAGTRAKKVRSKSYNAFSSIDFPCLAMIQDGNIMRYIPPVPYEEEVQFYEELDENYRYTFIDAPPLNLVSDGEKIGSLCDGALLVVRAGETPKAMVRNSIRQLERAGCPVVGIALSRAKGAANGYYHKYGNYYGKSYYGKGYGYYGKHGYYGYGTEQK